MPNVSRTERTGKRGGRPKKADAETVNQSETYKPIVNEDNRMESEKTERFNGNTNETENVGERRTDWEQKKPNGLKNIQTKQKKTKRGKKTMIMILIMILMVI